MLQNAYFLAKIGADTAENERNFAENLPKIGHSPSTTRPGELARGPGAALGALSGGLDALAPARLSPRRRAVLLTVGQTPQFVQTGSTPRGQPPFFSIFSDSTHKRLRPRLCNKIAVVKYRVEEILCE